MKALTPLSLVATTISNAAFARASVAFVAPSQSRAKVALPITPHLNNPTATAGPQRTPFQFQARERQHPLQPTTTTTLRMGYQLPPSPKGPKEQLESILPTIATGVLVALFFASPLGGIFFAVTNSLFVLALLTPVILFAGFQVWTALYTFEAPCPSCGALPVRALKSGEPSVCLNCGAYSRVNEKGDGLELCNNPYDSVLNQDGGGGLFDSLFGTGGNGMSDFDVVGGDANAKKVEEQAKKVKRQGTIIDVDVERD
mmetsp:Transcript_1441/g.3118  ORF Transcript_1441/g.3118 Transcript_1441/m.3118 type:complete len:257 (+) Transcript_1441:110-880(+)|eukprot:CAMPEP_0172551718 /NCGR_PEP_ID=MMETSP1067-20121228/40286_1 /TAXON_ID=265564 ORGANISM="Thalassiosira punctigera, Strain Tpunct2005C2" /NCGR_SAMPLE_ID=MMETSP1067 /ASSEMBLY_ACC=CAM_ASM_000444 /LENGTH=256 /DNA_ID=CAMNT_0013339531 /DNA_START=68 /DNA_END=838 /DNA_ORIENTATION=+